MSSSSYIRRVDILKNRREFHRRFMRKYPQYKDKIDYVQLSVLIGKMFGYFGSHIVSNRDGIVLDGLGYFANAVWQVKKVIKSYGKVFFNANPNIYKTTFFPRIFTGNVLNSWLFKLYREHKNKLNGEINKGMKYVCHHEILKKSKRNVKYYV